MPNYAGVWTRMRLRECLIALALLCTGGQAQTADLLTLDDAIALALDANYQQLSLVDQVELAELDYANARAAYKTKFLATSRSDARSGAELGSYSGVYLKKRNLSGSAVSAGLYSSDFGDKSLSELRFSYTLPFFQDPFSAGQLALTHADTEFVRKQSLLKIARQELAKQVTATYFSLILAQDRERITLTQLDIARQIREANRIKHAGGKLSDVDDSRAQLRYLSTEQAQQVAVFQRTLAEDNLRLLIGMDFDTAFSIDAATRVKYDETLIHTPITTLEDSAMEHRIELQGKRDELQMAKRRLTNVATSKLPAIDINLHYSLVGEGNNTSDSFNLDEQKWGVGFSMDTDFGGAERKNKRRKMYLNYQAHVRELDHLTQRIRIEVRSAQFEAIRSARMRELSAQEYHIAQRQYEQSEILHNNDQLNKVELLESEHNLHEIEHQQLAARVAYILSVMELGLASGHYSTVWNY